MNPKAPSKCFLCKTDVIEIDSALQRNMRRYFHHLSLWQKYLTYHKRVVNYVLQELQYLRFDGMNHIKILICNFHWMGKTFRERSTVQSKVRILDLWNIGNKAQERWRASTKTNTLVTHGSRLIKCWIMIKVYIGLIVKLNKIFANSIILGRAPSVVFPDRLSFLA